MTTDLRELRKNFSLALSKAEDSSALQELRVRYLGKKSDLSSAMKGLAALPAEERKAAGQVLHEIKTYIESELDRADRAFRERETLEKIAQETIDISLPGRREPGAGLHPLSRVETLVLDAFRSLGFSVEQGPEIEVDHYNFEALNFPKDHPARDMQDTFFLGDGLLLRTHTSPVQVRVMEQSPPPVRIVVPGRVYRCDMDATHSPVFHQVEGLCVGPDIHFQHFKGTIEEFLRAVFGSSTKVRFRPSFFPFTEPSAEVDIWGSRGWMEIMGCGMVDPNVFSNVGKAWTDRGQENPYDPEKVSGFAFGMGIERIAMLLHGIDDIRLLYENDLRFLSQIKG